MAQSAFSALAKRKGLLPVLALLIGVVYYFAADHTDNGYAASLYPYVWPEQSSKVAAAPSLCPEVVHAPMPPSAPPTDWSTFHQISSIRHSGWSNPDTMPASSDGVLSGKGHRASFRTNLRPDKHYFTTFPAFG